MPTIPHCSHARTIGPFHESYMVNSQQSTMLLPMCIAATTQRKEISTRKRQHPATNTDRAPSESKKNKIYIIEIRMAKAMLLNGKILYVVDILIILIIDG